MDLCRPVSAFEGRRGLRSGARGQLDIPRPRLSTYGNMAFSYADSSAWNSQPKKLMDNSWILVVFKRLLKTCLFSKY